jgi:mRNA interferase MazF
VAGFVAGDVVVLPFPFSNLSQSKRRPAFVLAPAGGNEVLLCQITSQAIPDPFAVELRSADFQSGSLNRPSRIRPNRVFTAHAGIILYQAGHVVPEKTKLVVDTLVSILRGQA